VTVGRYDSKTFSSDNILYRHLRPKCVFAGVWKGLLLFVVSIATKLQAGWFGIRIPIG